MSIILYQDFDGVNKKCEPLVPTLLRGHGKQDDEAKGVNGGCLTMRNMKNKKGQHSRAGTRSEQLSWRVY